MLFIYDIYDVCVICDVIYDILYVIYDILYVIYDVLMIFMMYL